MRKIKVLNADGSEDTRRIFPHCDPGILHRPGTCDTCDESASDLQELRKTWHIAFSGEEPKEFEAFGRKFKEMPCPASIFRPAEIAHKWYGNCPHASESTEILSNLKKPASNGQPQHEVHCSHCGAKNWFQHSTQEAVDYMACKCWKCSEKFWIVDESERYFDMDEDNTIDSVDCADGWEEPLR